MTTARSTNSDIYSQLNRYVTDYLTKHMYDANTPWPLRKIIRLPRQAELETHYAHIRTQDDAIRNWAQHYHCETSEKTKIISNGIVRQTSQLIDSVTIPDLDTALNSPHHKHANSTNANTNARTPSPTNSTSTKTPP